MADILCEQSYSTSFQVLSLTICMNTKGCSALHSCKEEMISNDRMSNAITCHDVNKRTHHISINAHYCGCYFY